MPCIVMNQFALSTVTTTPVQFNPNPEVLSNFLYHTFMYMLCKEIPTPPGKSTLALHMTSPLRYHLPTLNTSRHH
ncbi:uncharacterized protein N7525_007710 [Penicillium rubens]|uniref:uncharacterized protein n=1 Tax=Penicillium rubens TaxID=1108849 RepID=UPI002A5B0E7B|nr:uncharacterized protein N7525_007710 [Penicillium rubens]KAJ5829457.1 hypothetical protein N7525_007710 [Penicillium rubens]